ncbi:MAG: hypothetical protein HRT88_03260 [Lentisphaeraceae bacterium]|nr:hypothetical protein [Lentisphaeraceae bacterium]
MKGQDETPLISAALRISLLYALFGVLWVFSSDRILSFLVSDVEVLTQIQTIKGWIFVGLTTTLLYLLIKQDHDRQRAREIEKREVFKATISAMHHIVLNFLNSAQLFRHEASKCNGFSQRKIDEFDVISKKCCGEIENLSSVTDISKEGIEDRVYPK